MTITVTITNSTCLNIFQRNTYETELDWLYDDNEPKVVEKQQLSSQQSYHGITQANIDVSIPIFGTPGLRTQIQEK